jgi:phosphate:Na+ symporter
METASIEWGHLLMGVFGGMSLFLMGMDILSQALKALAGEGLKKILGELTTNRFTGAFTGALVTAIIQSSTVTTVLVVGFVSAGLLSLEQSIGVILGANIGSTFTAQIIAFKVTQYGLLLLFLGFVGRLLGKKEKLVLVAGMVLGLGLIFFGMDLMSQSTQPLRTYQPFLNLLQQMANPVLGILVGAVFTALVHSSAATTGIVIVLASEGFVTLEAGIALALGANIGTCVTAMLASIGRPREALRAATVHILFNTIGVLIWAGFIDQLAELVRAISPLAEGLEGKAKLAAETPRQIANAHTAFNVLNTLLFIGFVGPLAHLIEWLIPVTKRPMLEGPVVARFLDPIYLETPSLALDRVRLELARLGRHVYRVVVAAPQAVLDGTEEDLRDLERMDDGIDGLQQLILTYLGQISQRALTQAEMEKLHAYFEIANHFENIGDTIETNLVALGRERIRQNLQLSLETRTALARIYDLVAWSVEKAGSATETGDPLVAQEIIRAKDDINRLSRETHVHLETRLVASAPKRAATIRVETDLLENLKRIYYFTKKIAKTVVGED